MFILDRHDYFGNSKCIRSAIAVPRYAESYYIAVHVAVRYSGVYSHTAYRGRLL